MIAFGCSIITPDAFERAAGPGIERAREPDSPVMRYAATGSIARSFNLLIDRAARLPDLEGLVLLHEDAELLDADFCRRLRAALADPEVAIVGAVGVRGGHDIAWWDGELAYNATTYRYPDAGGGQLTFRGPAPAEPPVASGHEAAARSARIAAEPFGSPGEVDAIYGVIIGLSPWAVHNLRFDESIGMLHGYDYDLCRQARAAGRKVLAAELHVAHHHSLDLVKQIEIWVGAHIRAADAWDERGPAPDAPDEAWKQRARQAEAAAAAARLLAASKLLQADASAQMFARELDFVRSTRSWRMTEALRRGNHLLRQARGRLSS